MCEAVRNPSDRRFVRRCLLAAVLCLVVYLVSSQTVLRIPQGALTIPLAGLAGLGLFGELVSVGLLILRKQDEFQRVLLTRSFLWAAVITMGLTTVWGNLELCARQLVPHLDIIWIPLILVFVTAAAKLLIFRKYRADHE
jgi:hypothetical protein